MQINFSTPKDFLVEVQAQKDGIEGATVRLQLEHQNVNMALERWYVRAGFTVLGDLYQMVLDCGVSPPAPGDRDGKQTATEEHNDLLAALVSENVTVRKGILVG